MIVADGLQAVRVLGEATERDRGVLLRLPVAVVRDAKQLGHERLLHRQHGETLLVARALGDTQRDVALCGETSGREES